MTALAPAMARTEATIDAHMSYLIQMSSNFKVRLVLIDSSGVFNIDYSNSSLT